MVGCQKSKCSSSWPPIITFICIVNIQTFILFTETHSTSTIQTSKRPLLCIVQENFSSYSSLLQSNNNNESIVKCCLHRSRMTSDSLYSRCPSGSSWTFCCRGIGSIFIADSCARRNQRHRFQTTIKLRRTLWKPVSAFNATTADTM